MKCRRVRKKKKKIAEIKSLKKETNVFRIISRISGIQIRKKKKYIYK